MQDFWTPQAASALSPLAVSADASLLTGMNSVKLAKPTSCRNLWELDLPVMIRSLGKHE